MRRMLLLVCLLLCLCPEAMAVTRLGLHVTQEELSRWRTRAVSGPYRTGGDVSTNSPGDWTTIAANKETFRSNPTLDSWAGGAWTVGSCVTQAQMNATSFPGDGDRRFGDEVRDAAFFALVDNGHATAADAASKVRTFLLNQAAVAKTKWQDKTTFCEGNVIGDGNPRFDMATWLIKLLYAYDYLQIRGGVITTADQNILDPWFIGAGEYFRSMMFGASPGFAGHWQTNAFPTAESEWQSRIRTGLTTYTSLDSTFTACPMKGGSDAIQLWHGGPLISDEFTDFMSNRAMQQMVLVANVAVKYNRADLLRHVKLWMQTVITYSVWPNGESAELKRWETGLPADEDQGMSYWRLWLGSVAAIADVIGRTGDTELYAWQTSAGVCQAGSGGANNNAGGPKGITTSMHRYGDHLDHTINRYAPGHNGDNAYRFDEASSQAGCSRVGENQFLPLANHYQQSTRWKNLYKRLPAGGPDNPPAYPTSLCGYGANHYGGAWGIFPGVLFQFGDTEDINIYNRTAAPDITSNLLMHLKFDEGATTTAQDSTVNNHDGTLGSGASWGPGRIGAGAVVLDGTTNGIVTVAGKLGTPAAVTLAAWFKRSGFPTTDGDVLSIADHVILRTSNTYVRGSYNVALNSFTPAVFNTPGDTTSWHHLVYTVAGGTQQLYLDGEPVAASASTAPIVWTGRGTDTIMGGHAFTLTDKRFQGSLDDVRVYGRALTPTDVAALYAHEEAVTLQVLITSPTSNPTHTTSTATLTNLGGAVTGPLPITSVTWTCPPCSPSSGTATQPTATTWNVPTVTFPAAGTYLLTVTASDGTSTASDQLTVTYTPPVSGPACTHYASQAGGGNGSSQGSPFQVAQFWAVARPGDVLCLLNGTYSGGNSVLQTPTSFAGTAAQPITIRALNDGQVTIDGGNGGPYPAWLRGNWGVVEGINFNGGSNFTMAFAGNDWKVKRVVIYNTYPIGQNNLVGMSGLRNTLEDCGIFGIFRIGLTAGSGNPTPTFNTVRRCWVRWEERVAGTSPTLGMVMGYAGQSNVLFENIIGTRNRRPGTPLTDPEPPFYMLATQNSKVLGSIAYVTPGDIYDSAKFFAHYVAHGSFPEAPRSKNNLVQDLLVYGPGFNVRAFDLVGDAGQFNTANNLLGVSQQAGSCPTDSWHGCATLRHATSLAAALNLYPNPKPTSVWTALPGICKRYVNGTLTSEGLWPWPMNQRIKDAMTVSNRTPVVDVTATMQSLFGTIPESCKTSGPIDPEEPCPPPMVGTPPNCSCPPGTEPPDCTPPVPVNPTAFFVATTGSDSAPCTLELPCATINRARSLMDSGDTLYLRGGIYTQKISTLTQPFPPGVSWDAPTRIAAYNNETVTIQGSSDIILRFGNATTDRYLVLDRLTCDGQSTAGNNTNCLVIDNGAHHIRVQNSTLRNSHFENVSVSHANNIEFVDSVIQGSTHKAGLVVSGTTDSFRMERTTVQNNATVGLDSSTGTLTNVLLSDNTFKHNGSTCLRIGNGTFTVRNQVVSQCVTGVQVATGSTNSQLVNLTTADHPGVGLQIDAGASGTAVVNTISGRNGTNLVNNGTDTTQTTNFFGDPGFVAVGDYHIANPASPVLDVGTVQTAFTHDRDGVTRPVGTGWDIGAYDRAGTGVVEPPAPGPVSVIPWQTTLMLTPGP